MTQQLLHRSHRCRFGWLAIVAVLSFVGAACDTPAKSPTLLPTVQMKLGDKSFTLEVADNDPARNTGLMNRDSMPDDHGMIFVFSDEDERGFWMKNTRIRLDIVFISAGQKIVSVRTMEPFDLRTTHSDAAAKYAVELNAGAANAAGAKAGDQLSIPAAVKSKD